MPKKDPRIDAVIAKSPDFAKPILTHLRKLVHQACPNAEENIKWGMPFFTHSGSPMCNMAAFKAHATFGFWLGKLVVGEGAAAETAMGQFGRLASVKDLPSDKAMIGYLKKAAKLAEAGVKSPTRVPDSKPKPAPRAPAWLQAALRRDAKAAAGFQGLTPGKQREYIEWLEEAKSGETREKRLLQALEWMAEGKGRNWKYEKK